MKNTLTNTWCGVMVALAVLSGGFLSSCGVEPTQPLATTPKIEMGLSGTPSAQTLNTSVVKPKIDSFGIIIHKNAVPDSASFISRFALFAITDFIKQEKAMPLPV